MREAQLAPSAGIIEASRRTMEDIKHTVHAMQDEATLFADPNDRASQGADMASQLRNRDRERRRIRKDDEALARFRDRE